MDTSDVLTRWAAEHLAAARADSERTHLHAQLTATADIIADAIVSLERRIGQLESTLAEVDARAGSAQRSVAACVELIDDVLARLGDTEQRLGRGAV